MRIRITYNHILKRLTNKMSQITQFFRNLLHFPNPKQIFKIDAKWRVSSFLAFLLWALQYIVLRKHRTRPLNLVVPIGNVFYFRRDYIVSNILSYLKTKNIFYQVFTLFPNGFLKITNHHQSISRSSNKRVH